MADNSDEQRGKNAWFARLRSFVAGQKADNQDVSKSPVEETSGCCESVVHIAYRGVSDDRLYMAYDRKWREVKFFRPNGLRVYCAGCRRKLYP